MIAIIVGFCLTKAFKFRSRRAGRATFSMITFLGVCLSWYIAFGRTGH
jgi:hypothetical protein